MRSPRGLGLHRPPVKSHAGARVLRRHANHRRFFNPIGAHLPHHLRNIWPPVPHPHIHWNRLARSRQLRLYQPRLRKGDLRQRAAPDQRVAVLNLLHHRLRQRPPAHHVAQILGNLLHRLRSSVRQQQNRLFSHARPPAETPAPSSPLPARSPPALPAQFRAQD